MSESITCPTGLTDRIRGMKVREERVLADRRLAKSGDQADELPAACWEETPKPAIVMPRRPIAMSEIPTQSSDPAGGGATHPCSQLV